MQKKSFIAGKKSKLDISNRSGFSTKNENQQLNADLCVMEMVERDEIKDKVDKFINDTIELLSNNSLSNGREEEGKYELIDKIELARLKNLNNELKDKEEEFIEEFNSLANLQNNLMKDIGILNKKHEQSRKSSIDTIPTLVSKNKNLKYQNEKLKKDRDLLKIKTDNIIRTLLYLINYYDTKLPKEFNRIIEHYNTSTYLNSNSYNKKIELMQLQDKLASLKDELANK